MPHYPPAERAQIDGIDPRVRAFRIGALVTSFAVISQRYVVLIDTLINHEAATFALDQVRDALDGRQLLIVNTHADWDHSWGNAIFAGPAALHPATIIAHRLCGERMRSAEMRAGLADMQQQAPDDFGAVQIQPPTITFDQHLAIDGGDLSFELFPTPGHQPDHISVFVPQIRTLFAGDAAEVPLPYVAHADTLPELRASLATLAAYDADIVLYCHAPGRTDCEVIRDNIAYFGDLERRTRMAVEAGNVPTTLGAADDIERLIGFPSNDVPGMRALSEREQAEYRENHQLAARAMLSYVRSTKEHT